MAHPPDAKRHGGSDRGASRAPGGLTCGFCGRDFEEDRGQPACRSCPLGDACRFVRCPHCGYENPVRPAWLERLSALVGADRGGPDRGGGGRGEL